MILARVNDAEQTRYYIDPKTARVVGSYSTRNWMSRWLYHGLHSLDFPWLYNHRPLWDIVVITLHAGRHGALRDVADPRLARDRIVPAGPLKPISVTTILNRSVGGQEVDSRRVSAPVRNAATETLRH